VIPRRFSSPFSRFFARVSYSTVTGFLLSAKARTLRLREIYRMSDDEAFALFAEIRFAETGCEPFCPDCGCLKPYFISTRRK
jgi:hypothetical protein